MLIKLPDVDGWLKNKSENSSFIIGILLIGTTILTHIITVVSPFSRYEKLETNKWMMIDHISSTFLGDALFPPNRIVANIMVPRRIFYSKLVPCFEKCFLGKLKCIKKRLFARELKPVWLSNNHTLNKKFRITISQGATGIAYSEGVVTIVNLPQSINSLNLNQKQIGSISGNGFLVSYPIFALIRNTND